MLKLLCVKSEINERLNTRFHDLYSDVVSELKSVTLRRQDNEQGIQGHKPWFTLFDKVVQIAVTYRTKILSDECLIYADSVNSTPMFLAGSPVGNRGRVNTKGGRKENSTVNQILAHDNDDRTRVKQIAESVRMIQDKSIQSVFAGDLSRVGKAKHRVKPSGYGADAFEVPEEYEND
jgi:hypothetical protein